MKPARIQKVLSEHGVLSRRKAEEAVRRGRVTVNGRPCQIGQAVDPLRDHIAIDGAPVKFDKKRKTITIMLNKPRGVVTTTSDEKGRKSVLDLLDGLDERVYPIGRLDMASEGLLLLTSDGQLANAVMHPKGKVGKTYRLTVHGKVNEDKLTALSVGVMLEGDGSPTLPASIHVITQSPERTVLQLTIFEGRNRQVRRMCEAVGLEVARLRRTAIGPVRLGMLKPGGWRELTPAELQALKRAINN
jgi:23S rRNA pseudouridine2605 synthase